MPSFQGSPRRDVRRRLAAAGHASTPLDESSGDAARLGSQRKPGLYAQKALPEHHAAASTRIPIRGVSFAAAVLGLLLPPAALSGVAVFHEPFDSLLGSLGARWQNTAAAVRYLLNPRSPQGFTAVAGLLGFGLAACLANATKTVRRHRLDDHQGRYRAWGWLSGLLAVAAVTHVFPLGPFVSTLVVDATGRSLGSLGQGWWMLVVAATSIPIGLWAILPLTQRMATGLWLTGAVAAWLAAEGIGLGLAAGWQPDAWKVGDAITWQFAADILRLQVPAFSAIGTLTASRSVIREAQGLVQPRPARSRKPARSKPATPPGPAAAVQAEAANSSPAGDSHNAQDDAFEDHSETDVSDDGWEDASEEPNRPHHASVHLLENGDSLPEEQDDPEATSAINPSGDDLSDDRRLSKAERRRLKKLARKNRAA